MITGHLALFEFEVECGTFPSDGLAGEFADFAGLTGARVLDQLESAKLGVDMDRLLLEGREDSSARAEVIRSAPN